MRGYAIFTSSLKHFTCSKMPENLNFGPEPAFGVVLMAARQLLFE